MIDKLIDILEEIRDLLFMILSIVVMLATGVCVVSLAALPLILTVKLLFGW